MDAVIPIRDKDRNIIGYECRQCHKSYAEYDMALQCAKSHIQRKIQLNEDL